jgi:hypothetical protein
MSVPEFMHIGASKGRESDRTKKCGRHVAAFLHSSRGCQGVVDLPHNDGSTYFGLMPLAGKSEASRTRLRLLGLAMH